MNFSFIQQYSPSFANFVAKLFSMSLDKNSELFKTIDEALNAVRPHLQVDGGNIELVEVSDDLQVKVKWIGTCETCNMSAMTMKAGIEQAIRAKVPQVRSVEAVNGLLFA